MSSLISLPGLIDCHVHFREPGLEHKATMKTESDAALAGGVTTVCEMPNTIPATTSITALEDKVKRSRDLKVDIRFFFGATELSHLQELKNLFTDSSLKKLRERCSGLKLYFDHSTGDQGASQKVIDEAFKLCAELNIVTVCHCEDALINQKHPERPPESEAKAIQDALLLAKKYGTRLHVAHLSTKQGLDLIRRAKNQQPATSNQQQITCEVAPHHLFLTSDDLQNLGVLGKMNPPLRTRDHQDALWEGIADGTVDCIATDHAPHTLEEKNSKTPPAGVPGVETMLPLLLTVVAGHRPGYKLQATSYKLTISDITRLCFENPNRIFSLGKTPESAGTITIDPTLEWTLHGRALHSKCGWTPFEGWNVVGKVIKVL